MVKGVMMKALSFFMLLIIPLSLWGVDNLGDEYIGNSDIGMWRKSTENTSNDNYSGSPSYEQKSYFYRQDSPALLDSLLISSHSGDYYGGSRDYYFYNSYPDYNEEIVEKWYTAFYNPEPTLSTVSTTRYSLRGYKIEWIQVFNEQSTRIVYNYDPTDILISEIEYRSNYNSVLPFRETYYSYDRINRLIYAEWIEEDAVVANRWQSWSSHAIPDSIYTSQSNSYTSIIIVVNEFDENENLSLKREISFSGNPNRGWNRKDYHYYYVSNGEMLFPEQTIINQGSISSPDAPFTPTNTQTITYEYTNNFHSVIFYNGESIECDYNDDWLLTRYHRSGDTAIINKTINWHYYGPVSNQDMLSPLPKMQSFPNPSKDFVTFRLEQEKNSPIPKAQIYNIRGQMLRSLDPHERSGNYLLYDWDCRNDGNLPVPSGIYLIKLNTPKGLLTHRITVLK